MPEIRTETIINAPKNVIWNVLTGFNDYKDWNPLIPEITCNKSVGSKIKIKIKANGLTLPITAKITDFAENRRFAWGGPGIKIMEFMVSAEHYFEISEIDDNQCRFVHGEEFLGAIPRLLWPVISTMEPAYAEMNEALKRMAEAN